MKFICHWVWTSAWWLSSGVLLGEELFAFRQSQSEGFGRNGFDLLISGYQEYLSELGDEGFKFAGVVVAFELSKECLDCAV
jgi:hypothetical protein